MGREFLVLRTGITFPIDGCAAALERFLLINTSRFSLGAKLASAQRHVLRLSLIHRSIASILARRSSRPSSAPMRSSASTRFAAPEIRRHSQRWAGPEKIVLAARLCSYPHSGTLRGSYGLDARWHGETLSRLDCYPLLLVVTACLTYKSATLECGPLLDTRAVEYLKMIP